MTYTHYVNPTFKDHTWTMEVPLKHKFEELGSLASPCLRCGMQYALAKDHRGWSGRPCQSIQWTWRQLQDFTNEYMAFKFEPVIVYGPAVNG